MAASILVVDDDPAICTLLNRVLTRAGYRIQEAEDGLLALEMDAVERPALVLADPMMPRMKGDELVVQLKQQRDPIPCILMSAFHSHPPIASVPFLAKPFAVSSLLDGDAIPHGRRGVPTHVNIWRGDATLSTIETGCQCPWAMNLPSPVLTSSHTSHDVHH